MKPRSPVVAILGHVDHGKTTLLDYIRSSNITAKEHGGITQKIGAYEIDTKIPGYKTSKITFIDTPGHEAFTKLRARGAQVADIALLLIDGKDSLKPQTIESISHIKAAGIPYIVIINKIDLPDANPNKVKTDLMKHAVMVEGKGGNIPVAEISAKTGKGIPELLETILLVAAHEDFQYDPEAPSVAYIIETKKDKRGVVVTIVMKNGVLKVADTIYAEEKKAKIRSLINDLGTRIQEVVPSTPVELLGFEQLPTVGSLIQRESQEAKKESTAEITTKAFTLQSITDIPVVEKQLSVIIKTDSQGSLEAIDYTLSKQKNIKIILKGVGELGRSDIFLAKTTNSILIGFNSSIPKEVLDLAKQEKVIIKTYNIIYQLIEELTEVADLMKEKEEEEKHLKGEGKILATFIIEGEKIYGAKITKGKINLADQVEIYRNNNLFGKSKLVSLKIRAKPMELVKKDQDCGMVFGPPLDIQVGDVVKSIS
ncbi:MAG: Translation initiation factor IF-2 [Candidatus Roizmanbacteria bacterium GW2011_GWA2_36_23]|uniref:Translation initiation factor IF-2 n=1 Tax=Candidatus Roizmanbacteria bacterium GW2011_GWA2_36_23 TaxID=1618480 RepID=A0A0G0E5D0_9BACT|nr:MAG: Translation initiation factor IF-2 [Candidatus Roizmanbacteria bacterium GW2011_GWA2_36_23]